MLPDWRLLGIIVLTVINTVGLDNGLILTKAFWPLRKSREVRDVLKASGALSLWAAMWLTFILESVLYPQAPTKSELPVWLQGGNVGIFYALSILQCYALMSLRRAYVGPSPHRSRTDFEPPRDPPVSPTVADEPPNDGTG